MPEGDVPTTILPLHFPPLVALQAPAHGPGVFSKLSGPGLSRAGGPIVVQQAGPSTALDQE